MPPPHHAAQKPTSKKISALNKLYAKQQQRRIPTGRLPDPMLNIAPHSYNSFVTHLKSSTRILALFGAGLSAASGIPTFRGAGGFWRDHDAITLATPEAFYKDPSLVWQFYSYRRHMSLKARPNRAHVALARLAEKKPEYMAITQNIDGLSERANHPPANLQRVHGSLFDIRCTDSKCTYMSISDFTDPIVPALTLPNDHDISSTHFPLKEIPESELPHCPQCNALLRPGVVWFGEPLPMDGINRIHDWLDKGKINLMLVVGTSAIVWPAASYIHAARIAGARVAVLDMEEPGGSSGTEELRDEDWFFRGSAADTVPDLLKEVVGTIV